MKFVDAIYTCRIFDNGRFCFKVTKRTKTIDDYRKESRLSLFIIIVFVVLLALR